MQKIMGGPTSESGMVLYAVKEKKK
jgi:hypothetical protein